MHISISPLYREHLEGLPSMRTIAINLFTLAASKKRGIRGKMLNASWGHPYLLRLLGVQPN